MAVCNIFYFGVIIFFLVSFVVIGVIYYIYIRCLCCGTKTQFSKNIRHDTISSSIAIPKGFNRFFAICIPFMAFLLVGLHLAEYTSSRRENGSVTKEEYTIVIFEIICAVATGLIAAIPGGRAYRELMIAEEIRTKMTKIYDYLDQKHKDSMLALEADLKKYSEDLEYNQRTDKCHSLCACLAFVGYQATNTVAIVSMRRTEEKYYAWYVIGLIILVFGYILAVIFAALSGLYFASKEVDKEPSILDVENTDYLLYKLNKKFNSDYTLVDVAPEIELSKQEKTRKFSRQEGTSKETAYKKLSVQEEQTEMDDKQQTSNKKEDTQILLNVKKEETVKDGKLETSNSQGGVKESNPIVQVPRSFKIRVDPFTSLLIEINEEQDHYVMRVNKQLINKSHVYHTATFTVEFLLTLCVFSVATLTSLFRNDDWQC